MKRFCLGVLALLCLLTACSANNTTVPEITAASEADSRVVRPLPFSVDPNRLEDCTVAVSLNAGDAYLDDTGKMQMKVTIYDYALFDMVDIAGLAVGDRVMLHGEAVSVSQLERKEDGSVHINGGWDAGGYTLFQNGETVFYEVSCNDQPYWTPLGTAVVPVSENFLFTDTSNLEVGTAVFYPGDFLVNDPGIVYPFVPNNTTIRIENGKIVTMHRTYMP